MNTPASALRRRSQVFVEIPPSPLLQHSAKSTNMVDHGLQGNTPFKTVGTNVDNQPSSSTVSTSLKRKAPDVPHDMPKSSDDPQPPKAKKTKIETPSKPDAAVKKTAKAAGANASNGVAVPKSKPADGSLRCHQCARLCDPSGLAECTFKRPSGLKCILRYCKACLKNRYQLDIVAVKSRSPEGCPVEETARHARSTDYIFRCPRCREECNCRYCRKAKGLPATGDLNLLARKAAKQEAVDATAQNVSDEAGPSTAATKSAVVSAKTGKLGVKANETKAKAEVTKSKAKPKETKETMNPANIKAKAKTTAKPKAGPSKLKPHVLIPPSPYKTKAPIVKKPRVVKEKPAPPPKPIPKPLWSLISTPLAFDGAVERMHIREFLLRFAHLADIARSHLEELEELATSDPYLEAAEDDEESEASQLVGWISETALRAILIGLLTLLSHEATRVKEQEEDHGYNDRSNEGPAFTTAIQQIKNSGAHLHKMWAALDALRASSSLDLPDALSPPAGILQRSTRSSRDNTSNAVVSTAQLVPVVSALVESALLTEAVREDFERGAGQEKDLARAARELAATEKARYKEGLASYAKANKTGIRAKQRAARAAHEAALARVECAHGLAAAECVPRFGPLGRDEEGRVYYAVTPGVVEREAAVELLEGGKGKVRFGRRKGVVEDREKMKYWSWFIAVWGRKPEGALVAKPRDASPDHDAKENDGEAAEKGKEREVVAEDEDDNAEHWWGFWEPEEIEKLAEWLAMRHGINLGKKRAPKDEDDATVLDVDIPEDGEKRPRGRQSNASSLASSARASLNNTSDSEDDENDDDEDAEDDRDGDDDVDADGDVQMRVDARGDPVPTKHDLRKLARGLREYSETLAWRIKRASKSGQENDGGENAEAEEEKEKGKGKGKAVAKPAEGIAPTTFYGTGRK